MIEQLMHDRAVRQALATMTGEATQALARIIWHVITEPGDGTAGSLVSQYGAEDAVRIALADTQGGPTKDDGSALRDGRQRWHPRAQARAVRDAVLSAHDLGARLLLPGEEDWPEMLDDLGHHAPHLLWVRGEAAFLGSGPSVSMVGARAATAYGDHVAADLAGDLAGRGVVVVSGGAYGIDGAAHRASLGAGGATVAFLAGGVDRAYPAGHAQLFRRITESGCVVSEVPCGAAPTKWRFLARNRLIAALGHATVVVEAGWRSGSLNTAGHAATLGRPLGAVPGPVTSAASAGCHRLLREYDAQCVTTAAEVCELAGFDEEQTVSVGSAEEHDELRLLDAMSARSALTSGELAARSGHSQARVEALLGLLALSGRVVCDPDGAWRAASGTQTRR